MSRDKCSRHFFVKNMGYTRYKGHTDIRNYGVICIHCRKLKDDEE